MKVQKTENDYILYMRVAASVLCLLAMVLRNIPIGILVDRTASVALGLLCAMMFFLPFPRQKGDHKPRWSFIIPEIILAAYILFNIAVSSALKKPFDLTTQLLFVSAALPWLQPTIKVVISAVKQEKAYLMIAFALLCLIGIVLHLAYPDWPIDTTAIILLVLTVAPVILNRLKSLELTGIGRIELITVEQANQLRAQIGDKSKSVTSDNAKSDPDYSFTNYQDTNMKLALAGLRFSLERNIRVLFLAHQSEHTKMDAANTTEYDLPSILQYLAKYKIIDSGLRNAWDDIISRLDTGITTRAVTIGNKSYKNLLSVGKELLDMVKGHIPQAPAEGTQSA